MFKIVFDLKLPRPKPGSETLSANYIAEWDSLSTVIHTILYSTPTTRPRGKNTTSLDKQMIKQLSIQLKSRELKVEKIKQTLQQSEWQLPHAEQFCEQPFLPDDGIAPLRMQILMRAAES